MMRSSTFRSLKALSALQGLLLLAVAQTVMADRHGEISSDECPYTCRSVGVPPADCREFRNGDICFVEDLRKPTSLPGTIVPGTEDTRNRNNSRVEPPPEESNLRDPDLAKCDRLNPNDIAAPKIFIEEVRPGGILSHGRIEISGAVEGSCLVEAGYFEEGRRLKNIPVLASRDFMRFPFQVKTNGKFNAEIRVYNSAGKSDSIEIKPNGAYKHRKIESSDDRSGSDRWGL